MINIRDYKTIFILTHSSQNGNHTPEAYSTKQMAQQALVEIITDLLTNPNTTDQILKVAPQNMTDITSQCTVYYTDDSYDDYEIFEMQIQS